jgi:hypothetical protein
MKTTYFPILPVALVCGLALLMTSCGDIQQDLYLNADGSGKLEASFELGEIMSMMEGFDELNVNDVTLEEGAMPDTIADEPMIKQDPMESLMKRITDPAHPVDFDTLISLVSIMPDSVKAKQTRPDLTKNIWMRIQSPANSDELTIGMVVEFRDQAQLHDIIQHLDTIDNTAMRVAGGPGGTGSSGFPTEAFLPFNHTGGMLTIDTMDYSGATADLGMGMMAGDSTMASEDMGMMEMMFGNSKIRSIIHVPGEVISCSNKDAILTKDNRVIVEHKFMDVMKTGKVIRSSTRPGNSA